MGLSFVTMSSTQKPTNKGCSGISGEWNISDASVGTEELAHMEIVSAIVHQLTRNLTAEQIEGTPFANYYVDHTLGIWPQAASGAPWTSAYFQSKGDPITDLHEDMAADGAIAKKQRLFWILFVLISNGNHCNIIFTVLQ